MCFTDRYSSRQKLYLLHDESEEHAMLDMYINWCASRGVTVKRLHMDNKPNEHNEPMQRVLKAHKLDGALFYGALFYGALSTTSAGVETDRLNGRMRPLEESTRTLIVRANLPYSFWWYAMCHVTEVDAYPRFEERVFGCLAYPATPGCKKAPRGIYLGRSTTQPDYSNVFVPSTNLRLGFTVTTPNVTFVETVSPRRLQLAQAQQQAQWTEALIAVQGTQHMLKQQLLEAQQLAQRAQAQ